jgi:hypothetical protein
MKIRIDLGTAALEGELDDTATARDFAALLPLSLTLEDYESSEKICVLPKSLTRDGAPDGTSAAIGDIAYYAPWGNLALFYKPADYAPGLIRLGRITIGKDKLASEGSLSATITRNEGGDDALAGN